MDLFGDLPPPKLPDASKENGGKGEQLLLKRKFLDKDTASDQKKQQRLENAGSGVNSVLGLRGYVAERKGERDEMQDAYTALDDCKEFFSAFPNIHRAAFYAVFDGHAGNNASRYAANHLLTNIAARFPKVLDSNADKEIKRALTDAFKETDDSFLQEASKASPSWKDGSTAVCILVINNTIYAANVGDSRAILVRDREDGSSSTISLSKDHSPVEYHERMRIQKAGGYVREGRVLGILEVSRSIGDSKFKKYGVTSLPDVTKCTLSDKDRYIMVACDGLWKAFDITGAIAFIDASVKDDDKNSVISSGYEDACSHIANEAIRKGSSDNVTVILVEIIPSVEKR